MPKQSQIDKAIASLEAEIAVLQLAIDRLKAQQKRISGRKARGKLAAVAAGKESA